MSNYRWRLPAGSACLLVFVVRIVALENYAHDQNFHFAHVGHAVQASSFGHVLVSFNFSALFVSHLDFRTEFYRLQEQYFNSTDVGQHKINQLLLNQFGFSKLAYLVDEGSELINELAVFLGFHQNIPLFTNNMSTADVYSTATKPRNRRQASLFGALLSLGLGIMEESQIQEILAADRVRDKKINAVVLAIDDHARALQEHANLLRNLRTELARSTAAVVEYGRATAIIQSVTARLVSHNIEIQNFADGVYLSTSGRLCPLLVNPNMAVQLFEQLRDTAARNGFTPVDPEPASIFQSPLTFGWENGFLHIAVHIAFHEDAGLDLFRYVGVPIVFGNRSLCHVSTEEKYLAVDARHASYFVLSEVEFGLCNKLGNAFICQQAQLLNQRLISSCLGSIFTSNFDAIKERCNIKFTTFTEIFAKQLSGCVVQLVIPPGGSLMTTTCMNGTRSSVFLRDVVAVQVNESCKISIGGWSFTCPRNFVKNSDKLLKIPSVAFSSLLQAVLVADDDDLSTFEEAVGLSSDKPLTFEQALAKVSASQLSTHGPWVFSLLGASCVVISLVFITWRCRRRRAATQALEAVTAAAIQHPQEPSLPDQQPTIPSQPHIPSMVEAYKNCL